MKPNPLTIRRRLLAATAAALALPRAWAHGDQHADNKKTPLKKEQKDWGIAAEPRAVRKTIRVGMRDTMRFSPAQMRFKQGDTVRFEVHNHGQVMHEFVIGTEKENREHAELMKKFPNMEHDEPYMAHVPPGKNASIVWQFNRTGQFEFACLIAGHYDAGMKGQITVI
jgi:uncharacterized cupredoxin-like copper-binding protein